MEKKKKKIQPECHKCEAKCCNYITVHIDRPKSKTDYDNIRWYLFHDNVRIFVDEENDWCVEISTPCKYLNKDFKCVNYENRPKICRDYGTGEDEECEYYGSPYKYLFTNEKEFEDYLYKKKIDWKFKWHKN